MALDHLIGTLKSFQERFNEETGNVQIEDNKNVLCSRDSETGDVLSNENTYSSVIYVLSNKPSFIIAPGKSHEQAYIEIEF